jgi:hypothetical protein
MNSKIQLKSVLSELKIFLNEHKNTQEINLRVMLNKILLPKK